MSINKNNKNIQITLDPESAKLLESLAVRYGTSKSIIVKNAIKVYAAKKSHHLKISYSTLQEVEQTELKPSSEKFIEPEDPDWEKKYEQTLKELEDLK